MKSKTTETSSTPILPLAKAPAEKTTWGRPTPVVYLWGIAEFLLVTNPLQVSSKLRVAALRAFGAKIGNGVIFRPRTRVKFPWKLEIGDDCWIGEGAWFHNQDRLRIGSNVVISQEVFITTGSHRIRADMGLVTREVAVDDGAWVCTRALILGGCKVGTSAIVTPSTVLPANTSIPAGEVWGNPRATFVSERF